ncbi:MAG: glycosyltransferase, partial [Calditrichia bacterium]
ILPYIDNMAEAYTAADIIVCRAGAITLAELAIVGKPAVLVPYPHAAGKHQEHNARFIEEQGAAIMITEDEGWEAKLRETLEKLLANSKYRAQMAGAWKKLARPQAAENIADEVLKLMKVN